jgi:hypothetical protein
LLQKAPSNPRLKRGWGKITRKNKESYPLLLLARWRGPAFYYLRVHFLLPTRLCFFQVLFFLPGENVLLEGLQTARTATRTAARTATPATRTATRTHRDRAGRIFFEKLTRGHRFSLVLVAHGLFRLVLLPESISNASSSPRRLFVSKGQAPESFFFLVNYYSG